MYETRFQKKIASFNFSNKDNENEAAVIATKTSSTKSMSCKPTPVTRKKTTTTQSTSASMTTSTNSNTGSFGGAASSRLSATSLGSQRIPSLNSIDSNELITLQNSINALTEAANDTNITDCSTSGILNSETQTTVRIYKTSVSSSASSATKHSSTKNNNKENQQAPKTSKYLKTRNFFFSSKSFL